MATTKSGSVVAVCGGKVQAYVKYTVTETATTYKIAVDYYAKVTVKTVSTGDFDFGLEAVIASGDIEYANNSYTNPRAVSDVKVYSRSKTYTKNTSTQKFTTTWMFGKTVLMADPSPRSSVTLSLTVPALAKYTVSYNANGGSGAPSSQTKWYGKTLTLSTTKPTRTGYTFDGWYTAASGGTKYGTTYTANASATLYAHWIENTANLTYNNSDLSSGTLPSPNPQIMKYTTAAIVGTATAPQGYSFRGWALLLSLAQNGRVYYSAGETCKEANVNPSAETLYAVWAGDIIYNANGHGESLATTLAYYAKSYNAPALLETQGYRCLEWNTAADGSGISYMPDDEIKPANTYGFVTLYAQWQPNTYSVTLNQNGGSGGTESIDIIYDTLAEDYPSIIKPTKTGYTFAGYADSDDILWIDATGAGTRQFNLADENIEWFAKWTPLPYLITPKSALKRDNVIVQSTEGGEVAGGGEILYNNTTTLTATPKAHYHFVGWSDSLAGEIISDSPSYEVICQDTTEKFYYAIFEPDMVTIHYNPNCKGATGTITDVTILYGGTTTTTYAQFERAGYTFSNKWYLSSDETGIYYSPGEEIGPPATLISSGELTLYAAWEAIEPFKDENEEYEYTVIDTVEVQITTVDKTKNTYSPIPETITHNNIVYNIISMDNCFSNCASLTGNIIVNSNIISANNCFDGTQLPICIIFGENVSSFNSIWNEVVINYNNVIYLGQEDNDYYYTILDLNNKRLNIRVKDISKSTYTYPILEVSDGYEQWIGVGMNECYKDCSNLEGLLIVVNNPITSIDIFKGIEHQIKLLCISENPDSLKTWKEIAKRDDIDNVEVV